MTDVTTTAATATVRPRRTVWMGVLSNVERIPLEVGSVVLATMSRMIKGEMVHATIQVDGDALAQVDALLVEGADVRFYGEPQETFFRVIGPDLRARTLARTEARAETADAAPAKRQQTEKQKAAWAAILAQRAERRVAAKAVAV